MKFEIAFYVLTVLWVAILVPFHKQFSRPLIGVLIHCNHRMQVWTESSEPKCGDGSKPQPPDLMPSVSFVHMQAMFKRGKLPGWPLMYLPM